MTKEIPVWLLSQQYFPLIQNGQKKSTIRLGKRAILHKQLIFQATEDVTQEIMVDITMIQFTKVKDLTDKDAIKDGFSSLSELISVLQMYYDINNESDLTIVSFIWGQT